MTCPICGSVIEKDWNLPYVVEEIMKAGYDIHFCWRCVPRGLIARRIALNIILAAVATPLPDPI